MRSKLRRLLVCALLLMSFAPVTAFGAHTQTIYNNGMGTAVYNVYANVGPDTIQLYSSCNYAEGAVTFSSGYGAVVLGTGTVSGPVAGTVSGQTSFTGAAFTQPILQTTFYVTPNTKYMLGTPADTRAYAFNYIVLAYRHAWSGGSQAYGSYDLAPVTFYSEPRIPHSMTFPAVGATAVQLSWNNNGNPTYTAITVQRKQGIAGAWGDAMVGSNYSTFADTGLLQNTQYYYRIKLTGLDGLSYYSSDQSVLTATDPAVAAATSAKVSADAALVASSDAKTAAELVVQKIEQLKLDMKQMDMIPPVIHTLRFSKKERVTTTGLVSIYCGAEDNITPAGSLQQAYSFDGETFTTWAPYTKTLPITLPAGTGDKTVVVQIKDAAGLVSTKELSIYRAN